MIRNSVYNATEPKNNIEVIQCNSQSSCEGEIILDIPELTEVLSYTVEIYECEKPNVENDTWQTFGENLYTEA